VLRRIVRPALAVLTGATVAVLAASTAGGLAAAPANPDAGPPYDYTTELMGQYRFIPLKDVAMLTRSEHGYLFRTGQQDSHLVITRVNRGIRLVDTGTRSFKRLAPACRRTKVRRGIAAVCPVPRGVTTARPLLVEVWPRLGNDFTDGSSLPATIALAVLGDEGRDVTHLGAGPDFFNGHSGRDPVTGGAGKDWIRAGLGNDTFRGGPGDDELVGMQGHDTMYGMRGNDRLVGMDGNDRLRGNAGADVVQCGAGRDNARVDQDDSILRGCESVDNG
jgi:serralysin